MNVRALLARAGERTVRAGLVGVGQFGVSLVSQCRHVRGLDIVAVCDRDPQRCVDALALAGTVEDGYRHCDSLPAAKAALESGQVAVLEDASLLAQLPLDILVEATGVAAAAVEIAALAIDNGLHVAMVTKEAESVVGPELAARARNAGRVCTPVDGDQPGLLLNLLSWARVLGLPVVCAGKSSEYDFVFDPARGEARWQERRPVPALGLMELWNMHSHGVEDTLAMRAQLLADIPQRTVPDLCEMQIVVNATDLEPDVPSFHVPVARSVEVPSVFRPKSDGGILEREGVVDVFNCLRRRDEASFAGGVFVVVRCADREVWKVLRDKGHPVTEDAAHAMLYNPQHLLGVEAPLSLLQAVLLDQGAAEEPRQRFDLVARTTRSWRAGETLAIDNHHHHEVHGLEPMLVPARAVTGGNPVPYYMAVGQTLARDLAPGEVIGRDMIQAPRDSALWRVRGELEARYGL
jgi:predicted homoserine dehydrogenase-like protein